ncbi:juvenile hormone esterase [Anopheles darlingi]|uniref:Carboxylic ester hydrolase n=1 Tax=Anopheles darlingi TaxID=43151 RepID=W5JVI5_ANODA|nr:juvenile hormone esterase [Anopheles darlingi]
MVFFHGGGWQCGSGTRSFYGPDFLLEHDVIYIGANFRLGPLGFLSTEQEDCPGNNGLKDQSLVLRWVRDNIAAFGGNPHLVTVFGESAGGASGTYHMMSPLSQGLFHRVISQSGVNLNAWAQPAHPGVARARAIQLGEMFNCTQGFHGMFNEMLACLRDVAAEDITKAFYDFYTWDTDPMIPFPPVVEPNLPGAFITKHPRDVSDPHALELPWMTGLTLDEGALKSASLINVPSLRQSLNDHWDQALPISLYYDHHDLKRQQKITELINKFYFNNQKLVEKTERNLTNLFSDAWFLAGMNEYLKIRLLSKRTNSTSESSVKVGPTYVYLFAQKASASFTEIFEGGSDNYYGVCHAEELQYLFPIAKDLFVTAVPTMEELMEGSAYIWGFLVPSIALLFCGFYLACQGGGAIKIAAALQVDSRAKNKLVKKRGLQIGLFFKILIVLSTVVGLGTIASIWNVVELWSIYSIAQGVQGLVIALLVSCNCKVLKLYSAPRSSKTRRGNYRNLKDGDGGRYGVLSIANPNYEDKTHIAPDESSTCLTKLSYKERSFVERIDNVPTSLDCSFNGELSTSLSIDELPRKPLPIPV